MEIIHIYREKGLSTTSVEFVVSSTSIYKWDALYTENGEAGLTLGTRSDKDAEMQRILRENRELKAIVAEKQLTLKIKDSLLKKANFRRIKDASGNRFY
ncbi:hypothetical protein CLV98_104166 [Dyadobacter jejuensis]|uniref:Transposase n=1 Tax=Dyadobacter jejuensis TaxID=1082580 RepID=A0A316B6X1_9BACT|nr:transposase [Dyadobacter jejuensis]PWJ58307.1 hypothetical protein CLV98_104166 [Dyadobacter jejuensis]